jgi:urease accessory protein
VRAVSVGTLLLSDARFPAGGHAHSGGVEPAVTAGTVTDLGSLEVFLRGRLRTAGLVAAGLAAYACARARAAADGDLEGEVAGRPGLAAPDRTWADLDAEADARTPSPAQREASRRQGRALLRAARIAWPEAAWLGELAVPRRHAADATTAGEYRGGPHHAVVLGAAAAAAGCSPGQAAYVAAYQAVAGPASAAVRLLALDPMRAAAVLAGMSDAIAATAETAAHAAATVPLRDLPFPSAPALDLLAEAHFAAEVRLFES